MSVIRKITPPQYDVAVWHEGDPFYFVLCDTEQKGIRWMSSVQVQRRFSARIQYSSIRRSVTPYKNIYLLTAAVVRQRRQCSRTCAACWSSVRHPASDSDLWGELNSTENTEARSRTKNERTARGCREVTATCRSTATNDCGRQNSAGKHDISGWRQAAMRRGRIEVKMLSRNKLIAGAWLAAELIAAVTLCRRWLLKHSVA